MRPCLPSLLLALLASGCLPEAPGASSDGGPDGTLHCVFCADVVIQTDASLGAQVKGIVDQICSQADCHGGGAGGMGLSVDNEFASMIGVPSVGRPDLLRVKPGDPLQSYVYLKLACEGGIDGGCMPLGSPDPRIARVFYDWIEAGAPMP